jgi:molybdopterin/thiamine biosynthesis adenylyltransferase
MMAESLARTGLRQLVLVDPDCVEEGNFEMSGVTAGGLGEHKVVALTDYLRALPAAPQVTPVRGSVLDWSALSALKACDVLFCCVDSPDARLATAVLSTLYLKPLIDVGTGILRAETRSPVQMGADVRLTLPGDACLLCLGGVGDPEGVDREVLALPRTTDSPVGTHHSPLSTEQPWWRQRAGSLRSLNGVAVHLGVRLLEELVVGSLQESVRLRLDFDMLGLPHLQTARHIQAGCQLCGQSGQGDAGLSIPGESGIERLQPLLRMSHQHARQGREPQRRW